MADPGADAPHAAEAPPPAAESGPPRHRAGRGLVLALALGVGAAAFGAGMAVNALMGDRGAALVGTELGAPFTLVDQDGAAITEAAFVGRPSLLFFGFAHCPEICPTTVYDIETWFRDLGLTPDDLGAFFVTIDPERDTPAFLRDYLARQSDNVVGISGEPEAVWAMARSWRVYWQKRPLGDGDYTMDHFASVFVLDAQGRVVDLIAYGEDPAQARAKIEAVTS